MTDGARVVEARDANDDVGIPYLLDLLVYFSPEYNVAHGPDCPLTAFTLSRWRLRRTPLFQQQHLHVHDIRAGWPGDEVGLPPRQGVELPEERVGIIVIQILGRSEPEAACQYGRVAVDDCACRIGRAVAAIRAPGKQ